MPVWLLAPFFALWANLHGGFVFGWILIGVYLAGTVGEWLIGRERQAMAGRARYLVVALIVAVTATLLNPHGPVLLQHVLGFFGKRFIHDNTAEFMSPDFHDIDGRMFLCGIALVVLTLAVVPRRPSFPRLFAILVTLAFGLMAVRNVSLFGLVALPLLAMHVDPEWRALPDPRSLRANFRAMALQGRTWPFVLPVVVVMAVLAVAHGRVGGRQLMAEDFDPATFPVAAVRKARAEGLQGRMFHEFAWGGYLVFAWPEQRIFIDGGTDFFGEDLFKEYSQVKQRQPGWRDVLKRWDISLALLQRKSALAHELVRDPRWAPWYCDSLAVLLRRGPEAAPFAPEQADSADHALDACARTSTASGDADQGNAPWQPNPPEGASLHGEHPGEDAVHRERNVAYVRPDARASELLEQPGHDGNREQDGVPVGQP